MGTPERSNARSGPSRRGAASVASMAAECKHSRTGSACRRRTKVLGKADTRERGRKRRAGATRAGRDSSGTEWAEREEAAK